MQYFRQVEYSDIYILAKFSGQFPVVPSDPTDTTNR